MRQIVKNIEECCGCTACSSICPVNAIEMKADSLGFFYPEVNQNICIGCNACEEVCQFVDSYNTYDSFEEPLIYGARLKNIEKLAESQSGGMSCALIETFLKSGDDGIIYGAAFDSVTHIVHKSARSIEESRCFKGSKYVQSDLRGIFNSIKNDLLSGSRVLFFGTGCQVAGLLSVIPSNLKDKLFTIDLICHAAPSPAIWEEYVRWVEKKHKSKVKSATFRNKTFGWRTHVETFYLEDGNVVNMTLFRKMFYENLIIRPSCTVCHFTNFNRVSDVTIGDFIGWEKFHSNWNDNKGISLVLINSKKGKALFDCMDGEIDCVRSDRSECIQPQLTEPCKGSLETLNEVSELFASRGFGAVSKKYGNISWQYKMKDFIVRIRNKMFL